MHSYVDLERTEWLGSMSSPKESSNGMPQGSVLSNGIFFLITGGKGINSKLTKFADNIKQGGIADTLDDS